MFGRNNDESRPDYYADNDGKVYRSNDFRKSFSPMWLLPILLIPLALLVWGGSKLLDKENSNAGTLAKIASPTPANITTKSPGLKVGVGGGPNDLTSTPAAKATATPTPKNSISAKKIMPTPKKAQVGVGGGPEDPSVPSIPSTGHGW